MILLMSTGSLAHHAGPALGGRPRQDYFRAKRRCLPRSDMNDAVIGEPLRISTAMELDNAIGLPASPRGRTHWSSADDSDIELADDSVLQIVRSAMPDSARGRLRRD